MARCCGGGGCSCDVKGGEHVLVEGTGSTSDPYTISADVVLAVQDNTTFDSVLSGSGVAVDPWRLEVKYAATAKLDHIPDVNAPTPLNGQVLGYNSASSTWGPIPPTTAAAGSVSHDTSLLGDGSGGSPLQVLEDPARFLATRTQGLGLSDAGVNRQVRRFATVAARTAADPAPELNTLSMVDSAPGLVDYWDGSAWLRANLSTPRTVSGGALMVMSGAYAPGTSVVQQFIKNAAFTTDAAGGFEVLSSAEISGRAGVLSTHVQAVGAIPFTVNINPTGTSILGTAYRVDDGSPLAAVGLSATITAYIY